MNFYPRITFTVTGPFIKKCPGCGCVTNDGPKMCWGCEDIKARENKKSEESR